LTNGSSPITEDQKQAIINHFNYNFMFTKESFKVEGEALLKKIKELIAEGNVRKIEIIDKSGREIMSFPLTIGVIGAVILPVLAAVGAMAALIGDCTITVEREHVKKEENAD
jgi:hypothetical protein